MMTSIAIPRRRWFARLVVPLIILAATVCVLLYAGWHAIRPATVVDAVTVVVRGVETDEPLDVSQDSSRVIQAPGWIEADPFSVYAGALVEGVVQDMLVLEGDRVTTGQPVAQLVSDDARIAQDRATADLSVAERSFESAKAATLAIEPEIAAAKAGRRSLQDEYRRKAALVDDGAVAAGPVERLRISIEAADAEVAMLEARRGVLGAKEGSAKSLIAVAAAKLEEAELALARTTVRSPIDGIVIERLTSPGSVIRFGNGEHASHVIHLYDPAKLQVRADVPLADAAGVGVGYPAEIIVDVLPDTVFTGEVTRFVHRADLQKNTLEAKVRINDPADLLKPDMLARVRILQPNPTGSGAATRTVERVFVPASAILLGDTVMVISDDNYAISKAVTLGEATVDGWREVRTGLTPGERVITSPVQQGELVRAGKEGR
ncbi:MAG: efflux RND transporter periplasmic adaptor subunit [Planctomycetes bacterium]|nr:efflux RND transporter periplasmic adaptor subunit [Planctomycetota bacterium]